MVELNFDRRRPAALLDLSRVRELREWEPQDGWVRLGAAVTYSPGHRRARRPAAGAGDGLAHGRLTADPQPRHGRRQPRVPPRRPATRTRRCWPPAPGRGRVGPGYPGHPGRRLLHRGQAQRPGAGRADPRRPASRRRPARSSSARSAPATRWSSRSRRSASRCTPTAGPSAPASARPPRPRAGRLPPSSYLAAALDELGLWESRGPLPPSLAARVRQPGQRRRLTHRRRPRQRGLPAALAVGDGPPGRSPGPGTTTGRPPDMRVTTTVNGERREVDDVWEGESLLYVLRERMGLPGSKNACEQGECGSCTVYLDGVPVCACLVAAGQAQGREIVTVEGLARRRRPAPRPAGVRRGGGGAVRLLHSRAAGAGPRPADPGGAPRPTPRSARRWPATSAAARGTRRSWTPCAWRRTGWPTQAAWPGPAHEHHRHRGRPPSSR